MSSAYRRYSGCDGIYHTPWCWNKRRHRQASSHHALYCGRTDGVQSLATSELSLEISLSELFERHRVRMPPPLLSRRNRSDSRPSLRILTAVDLACPVGIRWSGDCVHYWWGGAPSVSAVGGGDHKLRQRGPPLPRTFLCKPR